MIYLLIENTKNSLSVNAFNSLEKREKFLNELIKEYEEEYNQVIEHYSDLADVTFGEVWIDLVETDVR